MITNLALVEFKGTTAAYDFRSGNYISGRNFSGKSAIEQAIRALVLGYVPGMTKTSSGLKAFASGYPMSMASTVIFGGEPTTLRIAFERVKGKEKQTADETLATKIDAPTAVLFDPSLFFGLSDAARIQKACELVQANDTKPQAIVDAIDALLPADGSLKAKHAETAKAMLAAATVNDALAVADTEWKAAKKALNETKATMQKTAEGMVDLSQLEQQASALPSRGSVEETRKNATAERRTLADELAANAERMRNNASRLERIESLKRSLASAPTSEQVEEAKAVHAKATTALTEAQERNRIIISRSFELRSLARVGSIEAQLAAAKAELDAVQQEIPVAETECQRLNDDLNNSIEAEKAAIAAAGDELHTDDFENAEPGDYVASCVLRKGENGVEIVAIESWREVVNEEAEEAERMAKLNREQEISELSQALSAANNKLSELQRVADGLARTIGQCEQMLADAPAWKAKLAQTEERALALGIALAVDQQDTATVSCDESIARNAYVRAKAAFEASELTRKQLAELESSGTAAPLGQDEVGKRTARIAQLDAALAEADATIQRIAAYEQDMKRVRDAADARTKVQVQIDAVGTIIDLIAEKRQEVVSLSIDAPLKVANKLAAGILRGPLVFQEGELGMQVDGRFISSKTFSGTETALIVMGLTAGLAVRSKLRVLMLDEVGRLDADNAGQLMRNLRGMAKDGDIAQWIVIGPENERMTACAEACDANVIHV